MKLLFEIVNVSDIDILQKQEMYVLMEFHYANVFWDDFSRDLSEKQWVILLFSQEKELVGFSTQVLLVSDLKTDECMVLYSGDTIIAKEYWGSITLPIAFYHLIEKIRELHPHKNIYWMLISKGLRTYKFLSVFFNEYYPCHFAQTPPFISDLMNHIGAKKFGTQFDAETGIIKAKPDGQFLKDTFQPEIKTNNKVSAFFHTINSGYYKGDELLCMTAVCDSNINPYIIRIAKSDG